MLSCFYELYPVISNSISYNLISRGERAGILEKKIVCFCTVAIKNQMSSIKLVKKLFFVQ